jgi:hypothetical protein
MIIAGFIGDRPILFQLRDNELDIVTNFSLVGSGAYAAEMALHARKQTANTSLNQALYNVYEAKKIGETSPHVGAKTRMLVLHPPDQGSRRLTVQLVTPTGENALDELFRKYGPKPMDRWPDLPDDALLKASFSGIE